MAKMTKPPKGFVIFGLSKRINHRRWSASFQLVDPFILAP